VVFTLKEKDEINDMFSDNLNWVKYTFMQVHRMRSGHSLRLGETVSKTTI